MSANPSQLWLSKVDDFEDFEEGLKDGDSFSLRLMTQNEIRWVGAIEQLLVGTSGDVWLVTSNRIETPLTPTNFQAIRQVKYGSVQIQSLRVNDCLLFVDYVKRKIHELTAGDNKYAAPDMCTLAEHITLGGITSIFHQRNPDSIVWATIADARYILSFTYDREQNITSWARHPIDGIVLTGCCIPGATEDEVWIAVVRTINSEDVIYIERFAPRNFGTDMQDAFFVDCGITKTDTTPFSVIDGLDHLEGETVDVLGDGAVYKGLVVDGGAVTLPDAAEVSKAQVGLPYTSKVQPLRIAANSQGGTSMGSTMKVSELVLSLKDSAGVKFGASDSNMYDTDLTDPVLVNVSTITGLFTGEVPVHFDSGFSIDPAIIVSSNSPLPLVLRAIVSRQQQTGR
jgi:hypothetical protein